MLLGEYEHTIDDKNRVTLPAKFRQAFADGVVLARGLESCVEAYSRRDWADRVERRLDALDPLSGEARAMRRFTFSGASDEELDKQGRVTIPPTLVRHAALEREVVVIGVQDHLEIWDRAAWRAQLAELEGSAPHVAERLAAQRT
jgi:MraZ protein